MLHGLRHHAQYHIAGIVARARELRADLIAMGSPAQGHGGLYRAIMGSVVDQVVWHATCPVVVVRPVKPGEMPKTPG